MNDVRFALRQLMKHPGFTIAVVLTLGLAIGANTAIFSVLDGVLLRPAPFEGMEQLVMVWETDRNTETVREPASVPDFLDYRERTQSMQTLAAFAGAEAILTPTDGEPTRLPGMSITHDFLPMVGIAPLAGRGFSPSDDVPGAAPVALIGERLWERLYDRHADALGGTLLLNDVPVTIVGVVPREAGFGALQVLSAADYGQSFAARGGRNEVEVWVPLAPDPRRFPRSTHPMFMLGRLHAGATIRSAQQELGDAATELEATYPENRARGIQVESLSAIVFGPVRPVLLLLLVAVGVVLVVACANVANLLLARGTARFREVAVRSALGAGRSRLARQFLIEGFLLASLGAAAGILVATWGTEFLLRLAPGDIPRLDGVGLNGRVLGVTVLLSLMVGTVFGLVPTLQAFRVNLQDTLKGEGRGVTSGGPGSQHVRSALVVGQLALAVILVVVTGLLVRSVWELRQVDTGFRAEQVVKADFVLPASRYPVSFARFPDFEEIHRFNAQLLATARAVPGVTAAALAGNHPLDAGFTNSFVIVGREEERADQPEISIRRVSDGYLDAVGLPLREGRVFTDGDGTFDPAVSLLNVAAAHKFFPNGDALGQRIAFWGAERTVIGIVADERFQGIDQPAPIAVYVPTAQIPSVNGAQTLILRVTGDPIAFVAVARDAIRSVDPALAVFGAEPLSDTVNQSLATERFILLLLGMFAAAATLLALVGVYGMLSYLVARRGAELGIRLALGAGRGHLSQLVIRHGLRMAGLGLALGLIGTLSIGRLLRSLVFGVSATDPMTLVAVALLVVGVTLLASWLPAYRATRISPMEALRHE